jgi:hypothetical protein
MNKGRLFGQVLFISGLVSAPAAEACTVCHSTTAQQVRDGIFNSQFLRTLGLVALPVPLLAFAVAGIHFGMTEIHLLSAETDALEAMPRDQSPPGHQHRPTQA